MQGARLVILASGQGSNLQAVLDACADGQLDASVVAVISDRPDAYALQRATSAGVPAIALPKRTGEDRPGYDARLAERVAGFRPDYIVLAGWLRILSMKFLVRFADRVVNLHPALPGEFPGLHAIERAYDAFQRGEVTRTGVMVHLVPDEGVDDGPALATAQVPIGAADDLATLSARVHLAEHRLLVDALRTLITTIRTPENLETLEKMPR